MLDKTSTGCIRHATRSAQSERRKRNDLASFDRALMGADADTGPVRGGDGIGPWVTVVDQGADELVDEVGVRSAMATSLNKGKVIRILDGAGERADGFGQQMGEIRNFDFLGDFMFGFLGGVEDMRLPFDQGPLETLFRPVHVETLAVLPRGIEQESPDVG